MELDIHKTKPELVIFQTTQPPFRAEFGRTCFLKSYWGKSPSKYDISQLFDDKETNVELELMKKGAVQYLH